MIPGIARVLGWRGLGSLLTGTVAPRFLYGFPARLRTARVGFFSLLRVRCFGWAGAGLTFPPVPVFRGKRRVDGSGV
jgi:hypothetical protein